MFRSTFLVSSSSSASLSLLLLLLVNDWNVANAQDNRCLANEEFNQFFVDIHPDAPESIPVAGSCCMLDVCGLPCPEPVPEPTAGFGIAVGAAIALSAVVGWLTYFLVQGEAENYFVAGKSLPLWIVAFTLGAQSIDSNALLGNADLSYKFHFFDGACIPIGLGLSLLLNACFLAKHINEETNCLTLPDVLSKRYGKVVEVIISLAAITSFLMLLAGNLVGLGVITGYVWGINEQVAIWMAAAIVWTYTVTGGLFSVAYTDVVQGLVGWSGCVVLAYYVINNFQEAPPPSIGFPGYVYPDDETCAMYSGVPCDNDASLCCYNASQWCDENGDNCRADNGAYPFGDQRIFRGQMLDPYVLTPFPNAIFWNWCTIFILAIGNLGALDFQARCMAAKNSRAAIIGCLLGGCLSFFVGIPFAYLGAITRVHYGPDSIHAEFAVDTCSEILGLPTCAAWMPDSLAFVKFLTHQVPSGIGAWALIGIVAASMSTADGAILAMGTVFSHNIIRQFGGMIPGVITSENLLLMARVSTIPFTLTATLIGAYYRSSDSAAGATGYLLIVAFDIVLATIIAPLFGCFYAKKPSPRAALFSTLSGALTRIVMEFALPKDGFLLLPYGGPEFQNYGPAASTTFPPFFDQPTADLWDPAAEQCKSQTFKDLTGADSIAAFAVSVLVFVGIQTLEHVMDGPLINSEGDAWNGYVKDLNEDAKPIATEKTEHTGVKVEYDDGDA